ncbi:MAG: Rpn family recombination-promoting nuclease/putative transposase [Massilia sp.]
MSGAHDLEYKQLFGHPELVRDLLAGFTPFACFADLPPEAFERVNASFVSDLVVERHGDMLWRVQLDGECLYVFLLLEFQSRSDRWMALRMQVYVGLFYQDLVKRCLVSERDKLPPVLPLVFYNGEDPWSAQADLTDLLAPAPDWLAPFQAGQRYVLIDQQALDPATLPVHGNLLATMFQFELSQSPEVLHEAYLLLHAWFNGQARDPLRTTVLRWAEAVAPLLRRALVRDSQQPREETSWASVSVAPNHWKRFFRIWPISVAGRKAWKQVWKQAACWRRGQCSENSCACVSLRFPTHPWRGSMRPRWRICASGAGACRPSRVLKI